MLTSELISPLYSPVFCAQHICLFGPRYHLICTFFPPLNASIPPVRPVGAARSPTQTRTSFPAARRRHRPSHPPPTRVFLVFLGAWNLTIAFALWRLWRVWRPPASMVPQASSYTRDAVGKPTVPYSMGVSRSHEQVAVQLAGQFIPAVASHDIG